MRFHSVLNARAGCQVSDLKDAHDRLRNASGMSMKVDAEIDHTEEILKGLREEVEVLIMISVGSLGSCCSVWSACTMPTVRSVGLLCLVCLHYAHCALSRLTMLVLLSVCSLCLCCQSHFALACLVCFWFDMCVSRLSVGTLASLKCNCVREKRY